MRIGICCYPTYGGSGAIATELGLALASLLRDVAESRNLDVLHVHYAIPHAVSALLARDMLGTKKPRIVTTLHGTDITIVGLDRAYFQPTRYGIERSDAVTTVSEWLRGETLRFFQPVRAIEVKLSQGAKPNSVAIAPEPPYVG